MEQYLSQYKGGSMTNKLGLDKAIACIVGLGYIGTPLAEELSKSLTVIGFDVDKDKINKLKQENKNQNLVLTDKAEEINKADFVIICALSINNYVIRDIFVIILNPLF